MLHCVGIAVSYGFLFYHPQFFCTIVTIAFNATCYSCSSDIFSTLVGCSSSDVSRSFTFFLDLLVTPVFEDTHLFGTWILSSDNKERNVWLSRVSFDVLLQPSWSPVRQCFMWAFFRGLNILFYLRYELLGSWARFSDTLFSLGASRDSMLFF